MRKPFFSMEINTLIKIIYLNEQENKMYTYVFYYKKSLIS